MSNKETIFKLEEVEKRMHSINKKASANSKAIQDIHDNIENSQTFNFFYSKDFYHNKKGSISLPMDRIFFLCDSSVKTKINLKVYVTFNAFDREITSTAYFMLNEASISKALIKQNFTYGEEGVEHVFEFEFCGYLPEDNNFVFTRVATGGTQDLCTATINSITLEVTGKNIIILSRLNDFRVFITKSDYFLTKNTPEGSVYAKVPTNNVSLDSFIEIPRLVPDGVTLYRNRYFAFNCFYVPLIIYNEAAQRYGIDQSIDYFIFGVNHSNYIVSQPTPVIDGVQSIRLLSTFGHTYQLSHPTGNGEFFESIFIISGINTEGSFAGRNLATTNSSKFSYLTLNDTRLDGIWVSNSPVFGKHWEDFPNLPLMLVAVDKYGDLYFFDDINATYSLFIGKGCQPNAFLQLDGSITVYYHWLERVYRRRLVLNQEKNKYELTDDIVIFKNLSEIIEGYSTGFFAADLNRNWNYYENLDDFTISE